MLKLTWKTSEATIAAFRSKGERIVTVLASKMNILMTQLSSYVASQKLSGQVLNVKTGLLRASVHPVPAQIQGTKISAFVQAGGDPVAYGNLHETGGSRVYQVLASKQRALAFIVGGKQRFAASVTRKPLPARPFMGPSEVGNAGKIFSELQAAVEEAVKEP